MIRLNDWFKVNAQRPFLIVGVMILLLWIFIFALVYINTGISQSRGFRQLLDVTSLAATQKNRMLLESVLNTAQNQMNANSVLLCSSGTTVLSVGNTEDRCSGRQSYFFRRLSEPLPGLKDYTLVMTFPRLSISWEQILFLGLGFVLFAMIVIILIRIQRKFYSEVFAPLKYGILGPEVLRIEEFENLRKDHLEAQEAKISKAVSDAVLAVAMQVSHDIRSPVSALNLVVGSLNEVPVEKRDLIKNATQRINDIASDLLHKKPAVRQASEVVSVLPARVHISDLVRSVLAEKQIQAIQDGVEISDDIDQGDFYAAINMSDFSRVISNLLNNSIEACAGRGKVVVSVRGYDEKINVVIRDDGKGMPPEIVARFGSPGMTYGKTGSSSGSGLGVFHAKKMIESVGGSLFVQSQEGFGTLLTLSLPRILQVAP